MSVKISSREEAFASIEQERFLPIKNKRKYTLSRPWFLYRNCSTFSTFLPDKFPPNTPYNFLTIGVFTGAAEIWLMQNILCHPESRLVSIDSWEAQKPKRKTREQLDCSFMQQCYEHAVKNLSEWDSQISLIKGRSQDVLTKAISNGNLEGISVGQFDFVFIDGEHTREAVCSDGKNCLRLLKVGGWLLFDDVRSKLFLADEPVMDGLKDFLDACGSTIEWNWGHRFCECYRKTA